MIGLLLDIGNIIFTFVNMPQTITVFKNRRNLKAISSTMLIGYIIATVCFFLVALLTGGYIAAACCIFNCLLYFLQLHWKRKYRERYISKEKNLNSKVVFING